MSVCVVCTCFMCVVYVRCVLNTRVRVCALCACFVCCCMLCVCALVAYLIHQCGTTLNSKEFADGIDDDSAASILKCLHMYCAHRANYKCANFFFEEQTNRVNVCSDAVLLYTNWPCECNIAIHKQFNAPMVCARGPPKTPEEIAFKATV